MFHADVLKALTKSQLRNLTFIGYNGPNITEYICCKQNSIASWVYAFVKYEKIQSGTSDVEAADFHAASTVSAIASASIM